MRFYIEKLEEINQNLIKLKDKKISNIKNQYLKEKTNKKIEKIKINASNNIFIHV